ncbi:MAG: type II toxin-antitoxin system RelE/ParE family toxin [Planctomycetales bacterium]|nr:type II toxin-antitoxin system RelE/ParE family toxin [Planctomycetales bacterium]
MSGSNFEYHPAAAAKLTQSFDWYYERSPRAAAAFLAEVQEAVAQVVRHPNRWPLYLHGTRRFRLRRFPFVLVYFDDSETIYGLAVAHLSRRPGYWKSRVV